jgi:hypothetical protein
MPEHHVTSKGCFYLRYIDGALLLSLPQWQPQVPQPQFPARLPLLPGYDPHEQALRTSKLALVRLNGTADPCQALIDLRKLLARCGIGCVVSFLQGSETTRQGRESNLLLVLLKFCAD